MPMSARRIAPQSDRPGSSRWPGLRRKKVTLAVASTATPRTLPVAPSTPEGTSTASTAPPARGEGVDPLDDRPRLAVDVAREPCAEERVDHAVGAVESRVAARRGPAPRSERRRSAASPPSASRRPRRPSSTRKPRRARSRAATKPSPPLLPGPQRTTIRPPRRARAAPPRPRPRAPPPPSARCRAFRRRSPTGRPRPSRPASGVRGASAGPACRMRVAPRGCGGKRQIRSFHRDKFCYIALPADPR